MRTAVLLVRNHGGFGEMDIPLFTTERGDGRKEPAVQPKAPGERRRAAERRFAMRSLLAVDGPEGPDSLADLRDWLSDEALLRGRVYVPPSAPDAGERCACDQRVEHSLPDVFHGLTHASGRACG